MTGGKRLSEEDRIELLTLLCSAKQVPSFMAKDTIDQAIALLQRDDEPEFCTCDEPAGHQPANGELWACHHCGKPVKGE